MEQGVVIQLAQRAILTVIYVAAPMLGLSLIVGLAVSIFRQPPKYRSRPNLYTQILAILRA